MKRTLLAIILCTGLSPAEPSPPRLILPVPHTQGVCVLQESPDGRYLASGDTGGTLKIWDEASQQLQQTISSQRGSFLPLWLDWVGSDKLVCYGNDHRIHSYDIGTGLQLKSQPEQPLRTRGGVARAGKTVIFSPAQSSPPALEQWEPIAWTRLHSWELPAPVESLATNPAGDLVCLTLEGGQTIEMSLADGKMVRRFEATPENLTLQCYAPDGTTALGSNSKGLYLLGSEGWRGPFSHPPDLKVLCGQNQVQFVWNKKLVKWDPSRPENPGEIAAANLPDSFSQGLTHQQMVLGLMNGDLVEAESAHPAMASPPFSQVRHLAYDPKGRIYAGLLNGAVVCWSLQSGTRETLLSGSSRVAGINLSGDARLLTVSREKGLDFYDASQLKLKKSLPLSGGPLTEMQSSYDGRYLVGVRDRKLEVYDTVADRLLESSARSGPFAVNPTGAPKLARTVGGQVIETDLSTGKKVTFENYHLAALAYDDRGRLFGLDPVSPGHLRFQPVVERSLQQMMIPATGSREYQFAYRGGYLSLKYDSGGSRRWLMVGELGQVLQLSESPEPVQVLPAGGDWNSNPLILLNGGGLLTVGREHTVEFWKPGQAAPNGQLVVLNEGADWLVCDNTGLFDGTPEAERKIEWLVDNRKVRVDQIFEKAYRPGLLRSFAADKGSSQTRQPVAGLQIAPPQVEFQSPAPGSEISQRIVEVRVAVKDQGGGSSPPLLYVNGKAIPQSGRREAEDYLLQAPLQPGVNELRCTAMDKSGTVESRGDKMRITCTAVQAREPRLMVIAVGLNQAGNAVKLNFAEKDAQSLSERLQSPLFSSCDVRLLAGEQARTDLIGQAFQDLAKEAQAQDTLVLFLAGHGTLDSKGYHFLMSPGQPSLDGQTLAQWLREFPAQKQFVILDTCHAGAVSDEMAASFAVNQQRLARGSGVYMLAACRSDQSALELPSLQHGLLTYSLLEGLKSAPPNSRQQVTVSGLVYFVCSQVPDLCRQVGLNQDVFQFVSGTDFPIRLYGK
ncbi:caspase family protein [bacterium]|nr:caspase family protein [bacterium]